MEYKFEHSQIIGLTTILSLLTILLVSICCCLRRRRRRRRRRSEIGSKDAECSVESTFGEGFGNPAGDFIKFQDGENLSIEEILDAPGEVIGKSSYGTVYRAYLVHSNSFALLRFLRPTCTLSGKEVMPVVELLGSVRHPNLVPLNAFYAGPRGEKLMVHPFYRAGNLAEFVRDGNGKAHKWPIIQAISLGIARGIHHLHTAFEKPLIHGNLKSKNILLDTNHNPYVSDFGLHLQLTPTAGQQILEASAAEGYKAPELIKMKDACEESDIYNFGMILLELLTGKELINENPAPGQDFHLLDVVSSAILDDQVVGLVHPGILLGLSNEQRVAVQDRVLKCFQLAMACCGATRLLRPHMKQVIDRLEEIGEQVGKPVEA